MLSELGKYHIHSPIFFCILLVLLPVAVWGMFRPSPSLMVSSLKSYRHRAGRLSRLVMRIPLLLETLAVILLTVALVRPQFGVSQETEHSQGIDIILAMDISRSMEAIDISRDQTTDRHILYQRIMDNEFKPRLEVAREEVRKFIELRPHDRIGLLAFCARAYTACPPTLDHAFLNMNLDRLNTTGLGPANHARTGLAAPISIGVNRLKESAAKRRVLVLFTDGVNNVDTEVTPEQAADIAHLFNVIIHTVGIGSEQPWMLRETPNGNVLEPLTRDQGVDRELMREIARRTGGRYFDALDAKGLSQVMREINQLEKVAHEQQRYTDYTDLFLPWLLAGIALLLLAFLLDNTLLVKVP